METAGAWAVYSSIDVYLCFMRVIALLSTKGGAGKTSLATALAVETGAVLLDLDPQSSACRWRDRREADAPVVTDVAPARLQPTLEAARGNGVDLVVLDTPPRSETAALEAARAADLVVVPCRAQMLDLETVPNTVQLLELAKVPVAVAVLVAVPPRWSACRSGPAGAHGAGSAGLSEVARDRPGEVWDYVPESCKAESDRDPQFQERVFLVVAEQLFDRQR